MSTSDYVVLVVYLLSVVAIVWALCRHPRKTTRSSRSPITRISAPTPDISRVAALHRGALISQLEVQ